MPAPALRSADYDDDTREIVGQMSRREQVRLMGGTHTLHLAGERLLYRHYNRTHYPAGGNARLGVPAMQFCDGPRGVVSNHSICFPVAMQRGAGFDPDLEERVGEAIGAESRALGGNYFGGVCIDLLRHPAGAAHLPPCDRHAEAVTYDLYHGYTGPATRAYDRLRLHRRQQPPPGPPARRIQPLALPLMIPATHSSAGAGPLRPPRPGPSSPPFDRTPALR